MLVFILYFPAMIFTVFTQCHLYSKHLLSDVLRPGRFLSLQTDTVSKVPNISNKGGLSIMLLA